MYLYILRDDITEYFVNISIGSGYPAINADDIKDMPIRILKPTLISQYKLDDDFIFMDRLKNDISNTLKLQEVTTKQMMSMILDSSQISSEQYNSDRANKAKTNSIAEKMGLELMPDVDQLISDCNDEMYIGKRLLKHLNDLDQITVSDNEVSDFDLIDKLAKSKQSKTKKTNQMVANI